MAPLSPTLSFGSPFLLFPSRFSYRRKFFSRVFLSLEENLNEIFGDEFRRIKFTFRVREGASVVFSVSRMMRMRKSLLYEI